MNHQPRIAFVWKLLRYSYGVVILLAGLDKVLGINFITNWSKYTSPLIVHIIPFNIGTFVMIIGIIEVVAAILIFTKFNRLAFYIACAWLVLIAINLLTIGGYMDIAIRDVLLAIGAFATAELAAVNGYGLTGKESMNA